MNFTYNKNTYQINWISKSHIPNILILGVTLQNFKTLGIPGDLFFAEKTIDGKLKVIGKWGTGEAYEKHIAQNLST